MLENEINKNKNDTKASLILLYNAKPHVRPTVIYRWSFITGGQSIKSDSTHSWHLKSKWLLKLGYWFFIFPGCSEWEKAVNVSDSD